MFHRLPLDPPGAGQQLIGAMTSCKIELHKNSDGDVWCSVDIGAAVDGDTDNGYALLRALIEQFRRPAEGGVA